MKKLILALILILLGIINNSTLNNSEYYNNTRSYDDFKVIVKFDNTIISNNSLITNVNEVKSSSILKMLKKYDVRELQAVFKNRYSDLKELNRTQKKNINPYSLECWQELIIKDKSKAKTIIDKLKKMKGVIVAYLETPITLKPFIIPNDTNFQSQWHLRSTAHPLADIDAETAWNINDGRSDVIIAVCDGGVDYTHLDLDPGNRSRVISGYDSADDDNDPMDDLPNEVEGSYAGHGTNVAGVIGAITNNQRQVAGVMWNCKIMPVKMVGTGRLEITYPLGSFNWDFSTTAFPSDVADAIDYAVNHNANVINLSYGFADMGFPINEVILRVPLLFEAISTAYANDVTVVAAMGNEYQEGNPTNYPAAFAHEVIAVGATNNNSQRAYFSSTGPHIDVSAPGVTILTTKRGNSTESPSGTSVAAPIVSGLAGLILSQGLDRNFNLTNDDIRHILEVTADDIYPAGFDENTGYGKVNAYSALALLDEPNVYYPETSYSGTSVKLQTLNPWIYLGSRWNLAPGSYYSVNQYQVTKHITFSVPFCSVPEVWIRDRECLSLSFANPNNGFPWAEITNVTTTGFDVRYSVYFVKYNLLGQTINKWVPTTLSSSKIEYTAISEPNLAYTAGPISGSFIVCSSGSQYTVQNLPSGCTISWTQGSHLTRVSPQGSNPCTFTSSGYGSSWIKATITGNCGSNTIQKTVWAGKFEYTVVTGTAAVCPDTWYRYEAQVPGGHNPSYSYSWTYPSGWYLYNYGQNTIDLIPPSYPTGGALQVSITNSCGTSGYSGMYVWPDMSCYGGYYFLYPNPASDEVTITINENESLAIEDYDISEVTVSKVIPTDQITYSIRVYNSQGTLVLTATRTGTTFNIPLFNMRDGTYIVEVSDGKNSYRELLIIKHE